MATLDELIGSWTLSLRAANRAPRTAAQYVDESLAGGPCLAGIASPAEAVRSCRPRRPMPPLRCWVAAAPRRRAPGGAGRSAGGCAALRTLAARRAGGSRQLARQTRVAGEDFDANVVDVALRRIAALGGRSPTWPAQAICESTWMTVRAALLRSSQGGRVARR